MAEPDKKPPDAPKPSWINTLAQRSTGLPNDAPPPKPQTGDSSLWTLAGLGFQFALSVVALAYLGVWIDRKTGLTPWGVVTLCSIALIGNLYLLIKEAKKRDAEPKNNGSNPPKGGP